MAALELTVTPLWSLTTQRYSRPFSSAVAAKLSAGVLAPFSLVSVHTPFSRVCHW